MKGLPCLEAGRIDAEGMLALSILLIEILRNTDTGAEEGIGSGMGWDTEEKDKDEVSEGGRGDESR